MHLFVTIGLFLNSFIRLKVSWKYEVYLILLKYLCQIYMSIDQNTTWHIADAQYLLSE